MKTDNEYSKPAFYAEKLAAHTCFALGSVAIGTGLAFMKNALETGSFVRGAIGVGVEIVGIDTVFGGVFFNQLAEDTRTSSTAGLE